MLFKTQFPEDKSFQFFMAKVCGVKGTASYEGITATGYLWQGVFYVTEVDNKPQKFIL